MATFGIYQTLDPLYVTPRGAVYSGKIVGGDNAGRIAIKIFDPPRADADEPNWEPKYFLDRAQVQRRVAAAGGGHWAPIYATGFTPQGGAYYVTDYHALTARKMIDSGVPVDAAALFTIVRSVISGLEEIRRIAGRAHANLKPSNVLLVGKGPADELRAVLGDPGLEYTAQKDGEAGDLRALGSLIHELVLGRPVEGDFSPDSPGWERLGERAGAWRQLCADLLTHPIASRAATLAAAAKLVDSLAPPRIKVPHIRLPGKGPGKRGQPGTPPPTARKRRLPPKFKRRVVQFLAVVLLVGGVLGVLSMMEASDREELCVAEQGWLGSLTTSLAEPERRERFNADPHLRQIADGVAEIEKAGVQCRSTRPHLLGFLEFRHTRNAVEVARRVAKELAPESWPQLVPMRELAKTFEKRGWQQPATYLMQVLEGVRPTPVVSSTLSKQAMSAENLPPAGSLAQRIDRVLRLRPIIEQQAAASEADWQQLDERVTSLQATSDPIVQGFGALLRRESISGLRLTDEGFEGLAQLKQNVTLATQILDGAGSNKPGDFDGVRFNDEVVKRINPADVQMKDVRTWLGERPKYLVQRAKISESAEGLQKYFSDTGGDVAKSGPDATERAAFKTDSERIEEALRDLRTTPYIERDIVAGKLDERVKDIRGQIELLKRYYHAEDAADWLKNLAGIATTSDRLKRAWDTWVATLKSELPTMVSDREKFARNKDRTDKLRDVLQQLELLPPPPEGLTETFAKAARARREQKLDELVNSLSAADPVFNVDAVNKASSDIKIWFEDLKALNQDFPVRKALIAVEDRPDAPWRKKEAFWKDPIIRELIRADVERIEKLQKLLSAEKPELVKAANVVGAPPEVIVAAWRLLGDKSEKLGWPQTVDELNAETGLREKVATATKSLPPEEQKPLVEMLSREGPRRWRRFVENAKSEDMLIAATDRSDAFQVTGVHLADINPEARFNIWLCYANRAIKDNANPALRKKNTAEIEAIAAGLSSAAKGLPEPKASQVLDKLNRLKTPEPFADRDLGVVFALKVEGLTAPIEFRRVEPTTPSSGIARPFYLSAREVTLAQFAGAIEGAQQWEQVRTLPWPYAAKGDDARRGPRVWEWVDAAASPKLGAPLLWLTPDKRNDFPSDFHPEAKFNRNILSPNVGGMPSDRHPMQYVSAHAALYYATMLGCRLPSSAEWKAALQASGKTLQTGDWNLRDHSWEVFREHAAKEKIAAEFWPDRGAFPGDPPAAAPPAPSLPEDDGTFLFRLTPSESADAFADLIGNVSEYTCEVPDAFARFNAKTVADLKRFLEDTPDAISVIGGSALSAPNIPVDQPLPVKRTDRGFSDVGIRLAFTAPARNPAERLKWVLAGESYVWARTESADTSGR